MKKIRKGDTVTVICGKDRGRSGIVSKIIKDRALVEGINVVKKHTKPNPQDNNPGGIVDKLKSISLSNVMLNNPVSNKPEKASIRIVEGKNGKKIQRQRYFKSSNEVVA